MSGDNLTYKTQKKDPFTSLHKIKENLPRWAELEILRNGALLSLCSFRGVSAEGLLLTFFPKMTFCDLVSLSKCPSFSPKFVSHVLPEILAMTLSINSCQHVN